MPVMESFLLAVIAGLAAVILVLLVARGRTVPSAPSAGDTAGQQVLLQSLGALHSNVAVLAERMGSAAERIGAIEQQQAALRTGIARTGETASNLQLAADAIRNDLVQARAGLAEIRENAYARQDLERQAAESLRRLEQVIAGTSARGAAGENLVDLVFARLPAEWQLRDFRIGNRVVEFALRVPNGLVLPIDSKWPAPQLLELFHATDDGAERLRLKALIETAALDRAREVTKYLDPELTLNFGIAVVPDAVFDLCAAVQTECFRLNVVLVGQSMFVPYLLLVFQTVLRTSRDIDLEKLAAYVQSAEQGLLAVQEEIEGRLSRGIVMLANSRDALRVQSAQVTSSIAAINARGGLAGPGEQ